MTRFPALFLLFPILFTGCKDDDDVPAPIVEVPDSYTFSRGGQSTVAFDGQSTRIAMAEELVAALRDTSRTEAELLAMYRNEGPNGEDVAPFSTEMLNASDKSIRSKVAAGADYFAANVTDAAAIRSTLESHLSRQVTEVFPAWNTLAQAGQAGQIADGTSTRYVNAGGLEYNQAFAKSLIGALMLDQAINNYLSPAVLDGGQNREDQVAGTPEAGQSYTTMEHEWDEAYGYVFGAAPDAASPLATVGEDDRFLNEYLGQVDRDADFAGIAETVFRAFVRGRAAIVAGDFTERDAQTDILQAQLSKVIAVRGTFYLARGADALESPTGPQASFHALSEAYGFVYSLQFTQDPATGAPYFTRQEVLGLLDRLYTDSADGFWGVDAASVRALGEEIASRFGFSFSAAAN